MVNQTPIGLQGQFLRFLQVSGGSLVLGEPPGLVAYYYFFLKEPPGKALNFF
jgi:hypothetical protein